MQRLLLLMCLYYLMLIELPLIVLPLALMVTLESLDFQLLPLWIR